MSGAKPLLGTPIDSTVAGLKETKEVDVSAVHGILSIYIFYH